MRLAAILAFYAFAIAAIYTGLELAPDMTWPRSAREYDAAGLLIIGSAAKMVGHWLLLVTR